MWSHKEVAHDYSWPWLQPVVSISSVRCLFFSFFCFVSKKSRTHFKKFHETSRCSLGLFVQQERKNYIVQTSSHIQERYFGLCVSILQIALWYKSSCYQNALLPYIKLITVALLTSSSCLYFCLLEELNASSVLTIDMDSNDSKFALQGNLVRLSQPSHHPVLCDSLLLSPLLTSQSVSPGIGLRSTWLL